MPEIVTRYWDWLVSSSEPSTRNLVTMFACIALYLVFLSRGRDESSRRARRPSRSPDSVLRGGGD